MPGKFASAAAATISTNIDAFDMRISKRPAMSSDKEAMAQRLLSTVDRRPDTKRNTNGHVTHAGRVAAINSRLTTETSWVWKPAPAAMNPKIPIDNGTRAKDAAPRRNAGPIPPSLTENTLCQND